MYYYECVLGDAPTPRDLLASLPPNAKLGAKLQQQLRAAMEQPVNGREDSNHNQTSTGESSEGSDSRKRPRLTETTTSTQQIGGHVRLGFSMRTGELQAPCGYDKWSYAITSAGGIVHASRRQEDWNQLYAGDNDTENRLHPGDVVGCAILVNGQDNHIRFFQNGQGLGNFVIAKGKRQGGEAFTDIENGTYYPAASLYMGGSLRANFGPHWICPPRKMPPQLKKVLEPVCSLCPAPLSPEETIRVAQPAIDGFPSKEHQQALVQAIQIEAILRCNAYRDYTVRHMQWVRQVREQRGLSLTDLPEPVLPTDEKTERAEQVESVEKETTTDEPSDQT